MKKNKAIVNDGHGQSHALVKRTQQTLKIAMTYMKLDHAQVHLNFISDQDMRSLNLKYRKKNNPTDVLSFEHNDLWIGSYRVLGDILIAKQYTIQQAKAHHQKIKDEFNLLAVHGLLHLLGFNHEKIKDEKIMFDIQNKIIAHVQRQ